MPDVLLAVVVVYCLESLLGCLVRREARPVVVPGLTGYLGLLQVVFSLGEPVASTVGHAATAEVAPAWVSAARRSG